MQQVENIREIFKQLFNEFVPDRIIELGTGSGEFTLMLYDLRNEFTNEFDFYTFDKSDNLKDNRDNLIVVRCDIFRNINIIKHLIKENTLILCDNGNKIGETRALIPELKNNCVIMAHDFGGQVCWGWEEIKLSDVQDLVDEYGLKEFNQELMLQGAWISLIKPN